MLSSVQGGRLGPPSAVLCRGFKKSPLWKEMGFLALAPLALNRFSSRPAFCCWEIICTWTLLLWSVWETHPVHPPAVLTDGISSSSVLEVMG